MRRTILLDTGVLVAIINKRDSFHSWAKQEWGKLTGSLLTCEAVITESCFLLQGVYGGEEAVMGLVSSGYVSIAFSLQQEIISIQTLMKRYKSVPMSYADACLVRMSELFPGSAVLTLDSDFRIYRQNINEIIDLIIPNTI